MKKAFRTTAIIVASLIIGYAIGRGVVHFMGGKANVASIDKMKLVQSTLISFAMLVVSAIVNIILHEVGHLLGGLATGYKFLSFRIFNLALQKSDDGWRWKKFGIAGTLGQCLMHPPHTTPTPYFWYNVGGVAANLIVGVTSAALLLLCDMSVVPFALCVMLLATSAWTILMNGVPMAPSGVPNDGKNIITLWRHPEQRRHLHDMLAVAAQQSLGKRCGELPEAWFDSSPVTKDSTVMEISARNLHYVRLMDELRFDEARPIAEEIMALDDALPQLFQMEVSGDLLLLELATLRRPEVIARLWNMKFGASGMTLQKYVTAYRKYFPMKCAILYAYEMLELQSPESAQQYYDEVVAKLDTYAQPGEARSAIAIMERLNATNDAPETA